MKNHTAVLFTLAALILGVILGRLLFAPPDTKSKISKDREGIHIYSYYTDRNGNEVKDGWEYWLHSDMVHEEKYRMRRGKEISRENCTDYASWEHIGPNQRY
jgi:hypothetical protein